MAPEGFHPRATDGTSGTELACQYRKHKRCRFNPWVGKIPWRRAWQPTPVLLPEESQEQSSLAGYSPGGCRESDRTEATYHTCMMTPDAVILVSLNVEFQATFLLSSFTLIKRLFSSSLLSAFRVVSNI